MGMVRWNFGGRNQSRDREGALPRMLVRGARGIAPLVTRIRIIGSTRPFLGSPLTRGATILRLLVGQQAHGRSLVVAAPLPMSPAVHYVYLSGGLSNENNP
jgi:hypothetical protein